MYDELMKQLQYNEKESRLFVPNEIYEDLRNNMTKTHHIPFAYSYYYFTSWLYRYAKYGMFQLDNKQIKKILGYSPTFPEIDYIIKKNGILDLMEYTATIKDFPVLWSFDDGLEFTLVSEMEIYAQELIRHNISRKYAVKYPIKCFHRYIDNENMKQEYQDGYIDGTYYDFENTHMIPFEVFLFSMSNKEIGCTGFYLWSYLKMNNQIHNGGYDVSLNDLSDQTYISRRTMYKYLEALRKYRMIDCYHNQEYFCLALNENERKSNTYTTNDHEYFTNEPIEYKKMEVVKVKDYMKMMENTIENRIT